MENAMNYVGFRRRLVAGIIDSVILGALFGIIAWLWYITTNPTDGQAVFFVFFVWFIAGFIYVTGFWAWRGQTPGKVVMKIAIVKSDGRRIGIGKAILRYIGYVVLAIIASILFIPVFFAFRWIPGLGELRGLLALVAPYSGLILVIILPYWLTITLDRKKQGLHDKIARTYVVKTAQ
ncbi:RDD family protein [Chloroflexota bacterium]